MHTLSEILNSIKPVFDMINNFLLYAWNTESVSDMQGILGQQRWSQQRRCAIGGDRVFGVEENVVWQH